jgi:hypothetical protein
MSITYTWKITGLKQNSNGEVVHATWQKTGTDSDGHSGVFTGATPFTIPEGAELIPTQALSEDDVMGWIKAIVVNDYERHVNGQIQKQIDQQKSVLADVKLSWMPEPAAAPMAPPTE